MHRPQLLFLDEPTTGLDPQSRARMWDEVRGLRDTGTTVFLTTHYLEEADALSDRIAIIDHGKIVALGTPDELKRQVAGDVVVVGTDNASDRVLELLKGQPFVREATQCRRCRAPLRRPWRNRDATDHSRPRCSGHSAGVTLAEPTEPRRRVPASDRAFAARSGIGGTL